MINVLNCEALVRFCMRMKFNFSPDGEGGTGAGNDQDSKEPPPSPLSPPSPFPPPSPLSPPSPPFPLAPLAPPSSPSPPSLATPHVSPRFFPKHDIVEFIHLESLKKKTQSNQVIIETYASTLWKGFFDMKHKLRNIAELDTVHAVDMGMQLIDNLFWIIYHYSSNVQLTLFLTERGRLLYTEFLYMSRTHELMRELNTFPSIHDGFHFAIKKSIGSLKCDTHTTNLRFHHISSYRSTYRRMFQLLNRKYLIATDDEQWTDDQVNIALHQLNHKMSCAIHRYVSLFEHCIYGEYSKDLSLTGFLLLLQLLADVSDTHAQQHSGATTAHTRHSLHDPSVLWDDVVVRGVHRFILQNLSHIRDDDLLACLERGHLVQHKWTLFRAEVLHEIIRHEIASAETTSCDEPWAATQVPAGSPCRASAAATSSSGSSAQTLAVAGLGAGQQMVYGSSHSLSSDDDSSTLTDSVGSLDSDMG